VCTCCKRAVQGQKGCIQQTLPWRNGRFQVACPVLGDTWSQKFMRKSSYLHALHRDTHTFTTSISDGGGALESCVGNQCIVRTFFTNLQTYSASNLEENSRNVLPFVRCRAAFPTHFAGADSE